MGKRTVMDEKAAGKLRNILAYRPLELQNPAISPLLIKERRNLCDVVRDPKIPDDAFGHSVAHKIQERGIRKARCGNIVQKPKVDAFRLQGPSALIEGCARLHYGKAGLAAPAKRGIGGAS